jgi:hypothetical protein
MVTYRRRRWGARRRHAVGGWGTGDGRTQQATMHDAANTQDTGRGARGLGV